jgi:transposase
VQKRDAKPPEPLKKVAHAARSPLPASELFSSQKAIFKRRRRGLNNKVKLTLKRTYGFRIADAREVALFHALGKLPEHKFSA